MASPSPGLHPDLQEIILILLSVLFFPLLTAITIFSSCISPWLSVSKHIHHYRRWRALSSSTFRPRAVLVTDLHTPQALSLARTFYRAGHRVIGAGFEPYFLPILAHFSKSVEIFYRLGGTGGKEKYVRDLLDVVKKEKVELWVNCSGEEADLEVKGVLERETSCRIFQFESKTMELLQDEDAFGKLARKLGLNIPGMHRIKSEDEAIGLLSLEKSEDGQGKQYIIKSASIMDATNSEKALLPFSSSQDIRTQIKTLNPTPSYPVNLQESIPGLQYTAHALIIDSKPAAFVTYPTSTTQLTALPASSLLSRAMLDYTTTLSATLLATGHLSLTFLVPSHLALASEAKFGVPDSAVSALVSQIYAVACKPTPSLGALAFADVSEDLAAAYLSILPEHEPRGVSNGHWEGRIVVPKPGIHGYYFLGFEVGSLLLLPVLGWIRGEIGVREVLGGWLEFLGRVLWWREGWWEIWDPWVGWWAYGGFVVGRGLVGLWEGRYGDVGGGWA